MSGSGSSCKEDTQDGVLRMEIENLECHIFDGPESQGSMRIVKFFGCRPGEGGSRWMGANVRRKEESPFRCLTVKDIFNLLDKAIKESVEAHDIQKRRVD
jgi:hypothetical protein